jgi:hypothetical protein
LALSDLVNASQLVENMDGQPPAWIAPPAADREPNPPFGYVVSFVRFHERGFAAPASRFLRGLCYHYGVELHNFAQNAISQAATFVGVCEGFPGDPSKLGSLGPPFLRGATHAHHTGAEGAPRGAHRRRVDLAAGDV